MRSRGLRGRASLLILLACAGCVGCAAPNDRPRYIYTPEEFRAELVERAPELAGRDIEVPFELGEGAIALAHETTRTMPRGPERIEALVRLLHTPPPKGFGLRYHAASSQSAAKTLELGEGDCVALASVLVGLGRSLGWPIYYAEARVDQKEIHREEDLAIRAGHMVVLIATKSVRAVVDFTGPVRGYRAHVIDDLEAYAHLLNNRAAEQILDDLEAARPPDWERALEGFALATRVAPDLDRAWNNQGVALARLGRLDDARNAYARALLVNADFDSTQKNLVVLETRSRGETSIQETPAP